MKAAVYSGTRNLYGSMVIAAKSLLLNSDVDKIYFLIEDDVFPESLPDCIECINVSGQKYFPEDGVNMRSQFTYMALIRSTYALMFTELDRILSLDVDTIVDDDISDLWDLPIDDYYFSAAREPDKCKGGKLYVNIGVALYNLKKLRDGKAEEVIHALNTKEYKFVEQDAFSELCQGRIHTMSSDYNATGYTEKTYSPKIIHYAGIREWQNQPEVIEYGKYSWEDIRKFRAGNQRKAPKKSRMQTTYMIHACPERMWYVEGYLIPSLTAQGIPRDNIIIWNDTEHKGNLDSFVGSMRWVSENQNYLNGIWHLQDDIVICRKFRELTEKYNSGIVCGYCNEKFDGGNVNLLGVVPINFAWLSFPCIRIPNKFASEFCKWFDGTVITENLFSDLRAESKHDDVIWKKFLLENHKYESCLNLTPNIVDHIDYLIGGSLVNKQRMGLRRACRFEDADAVRDLEEKLKKTEAE